MAQTAPRRTYVFDRFRLDPEARLLDAGGEPVPIMPKALDLLVALVERAGMPVDHATLRDTAWHGHEMSEATLTSTVFWARKALGARGDGGAFIEDAPRGAYRFAAPVRVIEARTAAAGKRRGVLIAAAVAGLVLCAGAAFLWSTQHRAGPQAAAKPMARPSAPPTAEPGDAAAARRWVEEQLRAARAGGNDLALAGALAAEGATQAAVGDADGAASSFREALTVQQRAGLIDEAIGTRAALVHVEVGRGAREAARGVAREAVSAARDRREAAQATALSCFAEAELAAGELDAARHAIEEARQHAARCGDRIIVARVESIAARVAAEGRPTREDLARAGRAADEFARAGYVVSALEARCAQAAATAAAGDAAAARALAAAAAADARARGYAVPPGCR